MMYQNWSQPRKSLKSPDLPQSTVHRFSTGLNTPPKPSAPAATSTPRQCPLHFNPPSHICMTCRKSICLRCAITYCQTHIIREEKEVMEVLKREVGLLRIQPRLEEVGIRLSQSAERQQYYEKKMLRLIGEIEIHFQHVMAMLAKKKLQIIQYYDNQFQRHLQQYRSYDTELQQKLTHLQVLLETVNSPSACSTIEELDAIEREVKKGETGGGKLQKKMAKVVMGKEKVRIQRGWSQQNLQRVLYQIEGIPFKVPQRQQKRKKRVTTENAVDFRPFNGLMKSSSNSRIPSGRKPQS